MTDPMHATARRPASADPPRALLIDAMGTLVELAAPAPALRAGLASRFGLEVSEAAATRALAAEIRHYRAHMQTGRDEPGLTALRRDCARVLRSALPATVGDRALDLDELTAVLLDSLSFRCHADARDVLVRARAAGVRVVVVSNWDISLNDVLERLGLAPLLWAVVTSAAVGATKPAPEIFRHALALADVPAQRAQHVGDNLAEDVRGAQSCGIEGVLLRRPGVAGSAATPDGVRQIASLDELSFEAARLPSQSR